MAKSRRVGKRRVTMPGPDTAATVRDDPRRAAWEFLRRNAAYREDYAAVQAGSRDDVSAHWGLVAARDPEMDWSAEEAIWRETDESVSRTSSAGSAAGSLRASARCSHHAC